MSVAHQHIGDHIGIDHLVIMCITLMDVLDVFINRMIGQLSCWEVGIKLEDKFKY